MPPQTAKLREKKSEPGEAAAVQSETHLRGRGGRAWSPARLEPPLGRALRTIPLVLLGRHSAWGGAGICVFQVRKPRLTAATRSYVGAELGFQARLSDPKPSLRSLPDPGE